MRKFVFAVLCAGGMALLASPALGQPRDPGGADDGRRAAAAGPTAREQVLERQVQELQMQVKRLQEALAGLQPRPEARPQAAEGERRGPAPAARRAESLARPDERDGRGPGSPARRAEEQAPPPEARFQGMDGGRDGMARGMREPPAPPEARPMRGGPVPFAGRFGGPAMRQGQRGPLLGLRFAPARGEQLARTGPQMVLAQVRQLLDEARAIIARAEQLLSQQAPRTEADRAAIQRGPGPQQRGPGQGRGFRGEGRFGPPRPYGN